MTNAASTNGAGTVIDRLVIRDSSGKVIATRDVPERNGITTTLKGWLLDSDWPGLCPGMTIAVETKVQEERS